MKTTTEKQQALLDFIEKYQRENKKMPTFETMKNHFGISIAGIQSRLDSLVRKKFIERKSVYIIKK